MVHSLANEIILMDAAADSTYAARVAERDAIVRKAQEDALKLTQRAARDRDTSREEAIAKRTEAMAKVKEATISQAQTEAKAITTTAQKRQDDAVKHLIDTVCRRNA